MTIPSLMSPQTLACDVLRLGSASATRCGQTALLATAEDIAFSLQERERDDLFFFFGSFSSSAPFPGSLRHRLPVKKKGNTVQIRCAVLPLAFPMPDKK